MNDKKQIRTAFSRVIGQEKAVNSLTCNLQNQRLPHGLLFVGQEGTGKVAAALELARLLNCQNELPLEQPPDCKCKSCKLFENLLHPNLLSVFPMPVPKNGKKYSEKENGEISALLEEYRNSRLDDPYAPLTFDKSGLIHIKEIRDLRHQISLSQTEKGYRVVIIQPADQMNREASNALLKLLEEPPPFCVIILISGSEGALLSTIVSRCQVFKFNPLSSQEVKDALITRKKIDNVEAEKAAWFAEGSLSYAIRLLQGNIDGNLKSALELLRAAVSGNFASGAEIIDGWCSSRSQQEINEKLNFLSIWISNALEYSIKPSKALPDTGSTLDYTTIIRKMSAAYNSGMFSDALKAIEDARMAIRANVNMNLALDALIINIHRIFK